MHQICPPGLHTDIQTGPRTSQHELPEAFSLVANLPSKPTTSQNDLPGALWEPFGHQSPEQAKISSQKLSGSNLATKAHNKLKLPSRTLWEPFGHQSPEQAKMSSQKLSGSNLATKAHNKPKSASRDSLGSTWPPQTMQYSCKYA